MYRGTEIPCTELAAGSTPASSTMKKVIYIDVDDTLIRSAGSKRIPITHMIELVKQLYAAGVELYCWSRAGRQHAINVALEYKIYGCFTAFLTKPDLLIDDTLFTDWGVYEIHPSSCRGVDVEELFGMFSSNPPNE